MMSIAVPGAAARAWLSGCSRQSESRAPRGSRDKQRCPSLSSVPKCLESTEPLESIGKHWKTLETIEKHWKTVENGGKQWKTVEIMETNGETNGENVGWGKWMQKMSRPSYSPRSVRQRR